MVTNEGRWRGGSLWMEEGVEGMVEGGESPLDDYDYYDYYYY